MEDDFAKEIRQYTATGWRWVSMGAAKVLMTNGPEWLVGAKYTGEWTKFATHYEAGETYGRIANPYWEEIAHVEPS